MPAAVLLPWSWMLCGPSQAQVVTQLSSGLRLRVVWKGGQGEASSRSVAQKANLAGVPWVARSPRPGVAPATLSWTSRTARPMVALEGKVGPKQPEPPWIPADRAAGPEARMNTAQGWVVALMPSRLNGGCEIASTAARTTGNCCGRHPAMTALMATACTVASPCLGARTPSTSSGSRPDDSTIASTRSVVGGIRGRPSDQPRRMHSWEKSKGSDGSVNRSASRPRSVGAAVTSLPPDRAGRLPDGRARRHRCARARAPA